MLYDELIDTHNDAILNYSLTQVQQDEEAAIWLTILAFEKLWLQMEANNLPADIPTWLRHEVDDLLR
ncbi:hypothetical protein C1S86_24915 [Vibrio parahaemolyticus]|uniref:Uncharacterized protein n=1 Tax=Vibrio parahaemolyticus TaxID=670 RepID=A0A1Y1BEG5_VIBPH|nr:hypothetical protein [Vibrio parahaemolyticus]EGQ7796012.1 hypothetical protein [Vibrio parahaemolyticus]EGQ7811035.1 hypothetical protein [Vibrio parahaemolyticus]EHC7290902.1 hypothetical protein [Vibrio parahaemolyticus]EHR5480089.1 hypothetical protein [Vibrio parahaemolyticus]EJA7342170.1 hypothetical protein [Vibrio parahaemolyticus]